MRSSAASAQQIGNGLGLAAEFARQIAHRIGLRKETRISNEARVAEFHEFAQLIRIVDDESRDPDRTTRCECRCRA